MFGIGKRKNIEGVTYTKVSPPKARGYHCITCKNSVGSFNGSYHCHFGKPKLIVKNGKTTKDYYWCNGKGYK